MRAAEADQRALTVSVIEGGAGVNDYSVGARRLSAVIAIPTFRRPKRLGLLLSALPERIAEVNRVNFGVLVIDNDPAGSGESVAKSAQLPGLRYVLEPRPGIAAARSRALAEAEDFDLLAFIDDDEVPEEGWLSALLETQENTGAAAVAGRLVTEFPPDVDPWVLAGGYFQRPCWVTGASMRIAATNNLLLDLRQVRTFGLDFDERLGLAGGEDSAFTRDLVRCGGTIVWCQESVAVDHIEPDRLTRAALLRRAFAHGNVDARLRIAEAKPGGDRLQVRARILVRGLIRIAAGAIRTACGCVTRSLRHDARGKRTVRRGCGMVAAAFGTEFEEYGRS